jgi:hypothetical protein
MPEGAVLSINEEILTSPVGSETWRYSHAVKTERHYGRILLRECRELLKRIG